MVMLDGRHLRRSENMLGDGERVEWAAELLCVRYAFRVDGNSISAAQAIIMSQLANISTAIVRRKATFMDTLHSLLSYALTFKKTMGYDSSMSE